MLPSLLLLGVLSHSALARVVPRQAPCSTFTLTAIGEPNGTIRETNVGQNRIGGTYRQGTYYFDDNHVLYDTLHHNCLVDATSLQFLCTQGAKGTTNFTFSENGNLVHDGSEKWTACPAAGPGDDGSFNIFSDLEPVDQGCEVVTLKTGGFCTAMGRPDNSSTAATPAGTSTTAVPVAATAGSATTAAPSITVTPFTIAATATIAGINPSSSSSSAPVCPTDISSGTFQFPHLIVPTSPQSPDEAFGNSLSANISYIRSTLFNFDIPSTAPYTGTCSLIFLFPYGSDLDPSAGKYYFSGLEQETYQNGGIGFAQLEGIATANTTFNTTPSVKQDFGKTLVAPGNAYTISTFPCQVGQTVTYQASSVNMTELDYFQDSAPSPIGLYIVPCA
jgi:hypothetical protein